MKDAALFIAAAAVLLVLVGRTILDALLARAGVPRGRVLYCDTGGRETKALISKRHRLKGKPDYVLGVANGVVPVEIKSSRRPASGVPHRGHVMQLAAYCVLSEERFGRKVPYGVLRYSDGDVRMPFTPELREDLLEVLHEMRSVRSAIRPRNHADSGRCTRCSYVGVCDEAMV